MNFTKPGICLVVSEALYFKWVWSDVLFEPRMGIVERLLAVKNVESN